MLLGYPHSRVARDPSWCPTRRFARASRGIVGAVTAARPMPTQLALRGALPRTRGRTRSRRRPPARRTTPRSSAVLVALPTPTARARPENSQTITPPAANSIRLSIPKATRAIEPAEIPAPMAMANSIRCHALPPQARRRGSALKIESRIGERGHASWYGLDLRRNVRAPSTAPCSDDAHHQPPPPKGSAGGVATYCRREPKPRHTGSLRLSVGGCLPRAYAAATARS